MTRRKLFLELGAMTAAGFFTRKVFAVTGWKFSRRVSCLECGVHHPVLDLYSGLCWACDWLKTGTDLHDLLSQRWLQLTEEERALSLIWSQKPFLGVWDNPIATQLNTIRNNDAGDLDLLRDEVKNDMLMYHYREPEPEPKYSAEFGWRRQRRTGTRGGATGARNH